MIKSMTQGNPLALIVQFAIPIFLGSLFQQAYILTDLYILGHFLGIQALAVLGSVIPVLFMFIMISIGFTNGLCIITAQRFGAKDLKGVRKSFSSSLMLTTACCLLIVASALFGVDFILQKMNVPQDIYADAKRLFTLMVYTTFPTMFYNFFSNVMRALGDSKTPLYFLIFSSVLNAAINTSLVVYTGLGITGVAWGTGLAQSISVILCLIWLFWKFPMLRLQKSDFNVPLPFVGEHLRLAIPMTINFSLLGISITIVQSICNQFGASTIAAFSAATRIEQVMTLPLFAFSPSVATYAAQNFGACLIRRIRQGVLQTFLLVVGISLVMALSAYTWSYDLAGIFLNNPEQEVLEKAVTYLRITMVFYIFLGMIFVFRQALQGMGYAMIPLFASILELGARSFAALYLVGLFGYTGICYSGPVAWVCGASVAVIGYMYVIRRYKTSLFGKLNLKTPIPRVQKIRA